MADTIAWPLFVLSSRLTSRLVLSEALFFGDFRRLASHRGNAVRSLEANIPLALEEVPRGDWVKYRQADEVRLGVLELWVKPPERQSAWKETLLTRWTTLTYDFDEKTRVITLPELGGAQIILQGDEREHPERLEQELLATLGRVDLLGSLPRLLMNQLVAQRHLEKRSLDVPFMSLKRSAQAADEETDAREAKTIQEVCVPFNRALAPPIFRLERVVAQIDDALDAVPPQSVLLVGPSGVGKSVAVWGVAARREVVSTSGSRLVAGQMGFGMWQERCTKLLREVAERKVVLHLGNLVELMEVGRSEHNQLGIAEFLRPSLARGKPLAIAECTAEQLAHIERAHPQILQAFRVVEVPEPDGPAGRAILTAYVEHLAAQPRIGVESVALIDRLHRRYATYSAYPGRPMRFVRRLLQDNPPTPVPVGEGEAISATPKTVAHPLGAKEVLDAFTRETGLPRLLLDDAMPFDVDEVRAWFRARVIGQDDAVAEVVDLLVTIKAGLARPNRPLASFLFIGPTGVGKTEMAKAVAEFIFGSRERITRFDMSEYADPRAIQRLIGNSYGGEGLLTSRIREQPFSIICSTNSRRRIRPSSTYCCRCAARRA